MEARIEVELEGLHFTCTTTDKDEVKKMMDIILSARDETMVEPVRALRTGIQRPVEKTTRRKHKNVSIPRKHACARIRTHLVDRRVIEDILKKNAGKHITSKTIKTIVKQYYPKKSKPAFTCDNNVIQIYLVKSGWGTKVPGKHGVLIKKTNDDSVYDEIPWVEYK